MELIKSTKLHCFALMIYNNRYITIDKCIWWINSWLSELIIESNYLHNYIEKLFCQTFCFSIYKMLDTEKIKNPEMLKFIPDHLKTKKMCNYAVKNHFL